MLRSRNFLALAGKVKSHSVQSLPGISVPGCVNQVSNAGTHPKQRNLFKEES